MADTEARTTHCAIHPIYDEPCPVCAFHADAVATAGYDGEERFLKDAARKAVIEAGRSRMKTSEVIANAGMRIVSRGRNLYRVGWHSGYFVAEFRRGDALWLYGPDVPELKRDQVLANPYPDSLFEKAVKSKFKAFKVETCQNTTTSKP